MGKQAVPVELKKYVKKDAFQGLQTLQRNAVLDLLAQNKISAEDAGAEVNRLAAGTNKNILTSHILHFIPICISIPTLDLDLYRLGNSLEVSRIAEIASRLCKNISNL